MTKSVHWTEMKSKITLETQRILSRRLLTGRSDSAFHGPSTQRAPMRRIKPATTQTIASTSADSTPPTAPMPSKNRFAALLQNWSAVIAIVLFLVHFYGDYREFRGHTEEKLSDIAKTLDRHEGILSKLLDRMTALERSQPQQRALEPIKDLGPHEFARALPKLARIVSQPPNYVMPETITTIARKLESTDTHAPHYWRALFSFLTFASSLSTDKVPPAGDYAYTFRNSTVTGMTPPRDVSILFDGADIHDQKFVRCRITFSGRQNIVRNCVFIDCVFEFLETQSPSPYQAQTGRLLLAQVGKKEVRIDSL